MQSRLQATEEDLCAQLALVKEQLMTESQVKEAVTAELMVQLSNVKKENGELQVSIGHSILCPIFLQLLYLHMVQFF